MPEINQHAHISLDSLHSISYGGDKQQIPRIDPEWGDSESFLQAWSPLTRSNVIANNELCEATSKTIKRKRRNSTLSSKDIYGRSDSSTINTTPKSKLSRLSKSGCLKSLLSECDAANLSSCDSSPLPLINRNEVFSTIPKVSNDDLMFSTSPFCPGHEHSPSLQSLSNESCESPSFHQPRNSIDSDCSLTNTCLGWGHFIDLATPAPTPLAPKGVKDYEIQQNFIRWGYDKKSTTKTRKNVKIASKSSTCLGRQIRNKCSNHKLQRRVRFAQSENVLNSFIHTNANDNRSDGLLGRYKIAADISSALKKISL